MMNIRKMFIVLTLIVSTSMVINAQNTVGTIYNSVDAGEGYVLFEYMGDTSIYLIDNCGQVVHSWESDFTAGTSVYLQEDGSIIRSAQTPTTFFSVGGQGGVLEQIDWDGNLLWQYFYSDSTHSLHHDIAVMPNGNILAIAFELKTKQEAIAAGRDSLQISEDKLWPETIIEFQPIGTDSAVIVWEWHMWDHLIQDFDNTKPNFGVTTDHPELFNLNFFNNPVADWAHANALDYNADLDQIIISLNAFNEFVIIDHSTTTLEAASSTGGNRGKGGDILYRYGNPESYGHGDASDRVNYKQHNVQWIGDGLVDAGKIMIYNNGNGRPEGAYSSIDIITPLVDGSGNYILEADTTFAPDSAEWTYVAPVPTDFFSPMISGAQRLPNGNTLICQGRDGRLFEIDSNKDVVWDYWSPLTNSGTLTQGDVPGGNRNVFRGVRYPSTFAGFLGRDLTPGQPLEFNPDLTECLSTGIDLLSQNRKLNTYPNPVIDVLTLKSDYSREDLVKIYDIAGKIVYSNTYTKYIDVSGLEPGLYFLTVGAESKKIIKQ